MRWRFPDMTWLKNGLAGHSWIIYLTWAILGLAILASLVTANWNFAFISARTLVYCLIPAIFLARFNVRLPVLFFTFLVLFIFATTLLGEEFDFYERFWWWDVMLHALSAIGFGLIGFILVFMLFQGDRFAAPPLALALISFCFAITIGTGWEIYEFAMDQLLGYNMQKSGIVDTMSDIIVNVGGAIVGSSAGYFYLKGREFGGLASMIDEFVRLNRQFFQKNRKNKTKGDKR